MTTSIMARIDRNTSAEYAAAIYEAAAAEVEYVDAYNRTYAERDEGQHYSPDAYLVWNLSGYADAAQRVVTELRPRGNWWIQKHEFGVRKYQYTTNSAADSTRLGGLIEHFRAMEEDHGWTFMVVEHMGHLSYVLLDSNGLLCTIVTFGILPGANGS